MKRRGELATADEQPTELFEATVARLEKFAAKTRDPFSDRIQKIAAESGSHPADPDILASLRLRERPENTFGLPAAALSRLGVGDSARDLQKRLQQLLTKLEEALDHEKHRDASRPRETESTDTRLKLLDEAAQALAQHQPAAALSRLDKLELISPNDAVAKNLRAQVLVMLRQYADRAETPAPAANELRPASPLVPAPAPSRRPAAIVGRHQPPRRITQSATGEGRQNGRASGTRTLLLFVLLELTGVLAWQRHPEMRDWSLDDNPFLPVIARLESWFQGMIGLRPSSPAEGDRAMEQSEHPQ